MIVSGEQISLTDLDARAMTSQSHSAYVVGYNVQSAVDTQHHLIVTHWGSTVLALTGASRNGPKLPSRLQGSLDMRSPGPLSGRTVLIIEDEALIALDLETVLEDQGATTVTARTVAEALSALEAPHISAAILGHTLLFGDTADVRWRLKEKGVPFIAYSVIPGLPSLADAAAHVHRPAEEKSLIAAVAKVLANAENAN